MENDAYRRSLFHRRLHCRVIRQFLAIFFGIPNVSISGLFCQASSLTHRTSFLFLPFVVAVLGYKQGCYLACSSNFLNIDIHTRNPRLLISPWLSNCRYSQGPLSPLGSCSSSTANISDLDQYLLIAKYFSDVETTYPPSKSQSTEGNRCSESLCPLSLRPLFSV